MKRLEEDCPNGPLLIICCNWHNFYITITNIMKDIWNENWRDSNNNFKKRVFLIGQDVKLKQRKPFYTNHNINVMQS